MSLKIIDNFLDEEYFKSLNKIFLFNKFPWYFEKGKVFADDDTFHFAHKFYDNNKSNSKHFEILFKIFEKLDVKCLVRCKLKMTTKEDEIFNYGFHTDVDYDDKKCKTAILYLNTNNGKTIFENKEVNSVANRIVIFPSTMKHTATSTTNKPYRVVLNINYY